MPTSDGVPKEKSKSLWGKVGRAAKKAGRKIAETVDDVLDGERGDPVVAAALATIPGGQSALAAADILRLLRDVLPPEALAALPKGELWIPQDAVRAGVSKAMPRNATLKAFACKPEGVESVVAVALMGAAAEATAIVAIDRFTIDAAHQEMTILVNGMTLTGTNWVGWLVAPLAQIILRRTYGDHLALMAAAANLELRPDATQAGRFTVNLSALPHIHKLKGGVVLGRSVLDFVQVTGCRHAVGGIYLKGTVTLPGA